MKTLVVGDLHLKQTLVLPRISEHLERDTGIGRAVFLGDACDDWHAREGDALGTMRLFAEWVAGCRAEGIRVDVLVGNHDFCYIRGKFGAGSMPGIWRELRALLEGPLGARMACAVGPFLATHAGVAGVWADSFLDGCPMEAAAVAARLNGMLEDPSCWEALDLVPPSRGGYSLPGPLWADLSDLYFDMPDGLPQIVGHTPVPCAMDLSMVPTPHRERRPGQPSLWALDTLSMTSRGEAIGDGSLLLVDEDSGECERLELGGAAWAEACRRLPMS